MSRMCLFSLFILALVLFQSQASSSANRQIAKETSLMTKTLPDVPGKEGLIETVLLSLARSCRHTNIMQMSSHTCWMEASSLN